MTTLEFYPEKENQRLDHYLSEKLPEFSRSRLQTMIKNGDITVDGQKVKSGYCLNIGQKIVMVCREAELYK